MGLILGAIFSDRGFGVGAHINAVIVTSSVAD